MLLGLDVSNNNGIFGWNSVNPSFGIVKATQGVHFEDSQFSRNWTQMSDRKILRGAYHYMDASNPVSQAEYFTNFVKKHGLEKNDILALDVEIQVPAASIAQCVNYVKTLTGKNPFIYTNYSLLKSGIFSEVLDQPLWIANPAGIEGDPSSVAPYSVWTIQQFSWNPHDLDIFNGSVTTWNVLANIPAKG
jgi:lysozyme